MFPSFPFGIEGGIWDVIILIPDHYLSTYFTEVILMLKACVLAIFLTLSHIIMLSRDKERSNLCLNFC